MPALIVRIGVEKCALMDLNEQQSDLYAPLVRESLAQEIVERIQQSILSGRLRAGDRLPPQRELAGNLGVSPTVVREALKTLAERGLLETRAGVGTFIVGPSHDNVAQSLALQCELCDVSFEQLYEIRKLFEVPMAGLAAQRAKPQHIERLEEVFQQLKASREDVNAHIAADFELHLTLADATGNPLFRMLTFSLMEILQRNRAFVFLAAPDSWSRSLREHGQLCECVQRGDANGARRAMLQHLQRSERDSIRYRELTRPRRPSAGD